MKKIIVAPLNWGLGHATRCVPIIHLLLEQNFTPIIASDGNALKFLKKEFPELESLELPSYTISYKKNLKWGLFLQIPKILKAVKKEQKIIEDFIAKDHDVVGIISDNRFGLRSKKIPSVYITHQINVLSGGLTTFLTSKIHQHLIKKYYECWVPDTKDSDFSGKLSHSNTKKIRARFIGVLSRFKRETLPITNDILIILSGPEPHRTSLEEKIKRELKEYKGSIILIQGKIEDQQKKEIEENVTIYNYLLSDELQTIINESELLICRSGYSSIMDLAVLNKKVFFIPTRNQTEQEYLASYLEKNKHAPYSKEEDFTLELLKKIVNYKGLKIEETSLKPELLRLFKRK